jgi:hypothetical protein
MANPNIINIGSLYAKTAVLNVTTSPTAVVTNAAASNKVFKVTSIYLSNIDISASVNATLEIFRDSVSYYIMFATPVPVGATIDVVNKNIYLEEGDQLRVTASAGGDLVAVVSYEEIS